MGIENYMLVSANCFKNNILKLYLKWLTEIYGLNH